MGFYKMKLMSIALIMFIAGCREKDELTLPVSVHLMIGISQDNSLNTEYLGFTECEIGINRIWFEGLREAGPAVYFQTDPKINLPTITFFQPVIVSSYDIPQGVYNYMKWDITMYCIENERIFNIETRGWDWNDFEENYYCCKAIDIYGSYKSLDGSVIPFIFGIDATEMLSVKAFDPDGNSTIVLSVNKEYDATLLFNPQEAFSSISRESFEKAEISDENGQPVIIISNNTNKGLYEILLYRLFQYARVIVK
jgi:hypothetical protein